MGFVSVFGILLAILFCSAVGESEIVTKAEDSRNSETVIVIFVVIVVGVLCFLCGMYVEGQIEKKRYIYPPIRESPPIRRTTLKAEWIKKWGRKNVTVDDPSTVGAATPIASLQTAKPQVPCELSSSGVPAAVTISQLQTQQNTINSTRSEKPDSEIVVDMQVNHIAKIRCPNHCSSTPSYAFEGLTPLNTPTTFTPPQECKQKMELVNTAVDMCSDKTATAIEAKTDKVATAVSR